MKASFLLLLFLISAFSGTRAQNLLAFYSLNGNALDSLGMLSGTLTGATATTDRYNYAEKALTFSGTSQYINLGNSSLIRPSNAITVSCWFELDITGVQTHRSFVSCTENGGYNIQYYHPGGVLRGNIWRNGQYAVLTTPAGPYLGNGWHFMVLTFDGRITRLYLDGELKDTNDAGAIFPITYPPSVNTYIGAEPVSGFGIDPNGYHKGKLDEVRIYDYALSAAQINAHYHSTLLNLPSTGLVLWLKADTGVALNSGKVTQWQDISGQNHHLVQSETSQQPIWVSDAINDLPAIRFDGVNDILKSGLLDLQQRKQITLFIVNKSSGTQNILIEHSADLNTHPAGFSVIDNYTNASGTGFAASFKGNASSNNGISLFKSNQTFYEPKIVQVIFDKQQTSVANQFAVKINGQALTNNHGYGGTHTDNFSLDTLFVGGRGNGAYFADADISEIILYDRLLTSAEQNRIQNYLNKKYQLSPYLATSLPGSGRAMNFNGTTQYINIATASSTLSDFTLSYWIRNNGSDANFDRITSTTSDVFETAKQSDGGIKYFRGGWTGVITNIGIGEWHQLSFVRKDGVLQVFKNGIWVHTNNSFGNTLIPATWLIGRRHSGGEFANMSLDEFRLFNKALTQDEIRSTMCRKLNQDDALFGNLQVYYSFDDTLTSQTFDASDLGRHGTLLNSPTRSLSEVPLGDHSQFSYSGNASNLSFTSNTSGTWQVGAVSGTLDGLQFYTVDEEPLLVQGIDTLSHLPNYIGIHVVNGSAATYTATLTYNSTSLPGQESALRLYERTSNADSSWVEAIAVLDTVNNTLQFNGSQTEYILAVNPVPSVFYLDADGDGYGRPDSTLLAMSNPPGYVPNSLDCNDNNSLEFPGQVWWFDTDQDGYGNGLSVIQCFRPAFGNHVSELIQTNGDCNDADSLIYPGYQYVDYTGFANFNQTYISQTTGDPYTQFEYQVMYFNAANALPAPGFPRVVLDYEGNGAFTNPNDRLLLLTEADPTDTNTVDGKKYIGNINALPVGTNWKSWVMSSPNACALNDGPFDYPDILILPDLEIFANDITFSEPHPSVNSPFTVQAVIHNVSDYEAQNVQVRLRDQYDTTLVFPIQTINNLSPHSTYTVSWTFTTIAIPSWHPMEVSIDVANQIAETNELDNTAIRPYINGNYNLPGSIITSAQVNPSTSYQGGTYLHLQGSCHYTGTAIPLVDSSVAGATIQFTVQETGATYTGYSNSNGNFNIIFLKPLPVGQYHITGTCTDYTLTGSLNATFTILVPPPVVVCNLPNLTASIEMANNKVVVGNSLSGRFLIKNTGLSTAPATDFTVSQTGGIPTLPSVINVPSLASGDTFSYAFVLNFNTIGQEVLCIHVDPQDLISECSGSNSACRIIQVVPDLPDIVPYEGPFGNAYQCTIQQVGFKLVNMGGVATGPFNCQVITRYNNTIIDTFDHLVPNINSALIYPSTHYYFSMPFSPGQTGAYTFEVKADNPINEVIELNELNNAHIYTLQVIQCKPNLTFGSCTQFNLESSNGLYTPGSNMQVNATVLNTGNLTFSGIVSLRYTQTGIGSIDENFVVSLVPGQSAVLSKTLVAPPYTGVPLVLQIDPLNLINEFNEGDNHIDDLQCWDFQPVDLPTSCGIDMWDRSYTINQPVFIYAGVRSNYLYSADSIKVKFEVSGPGISGSLNLGDAWIHDLDKTCGCPRIASLPVNYAFSQEGTYQFTITVDPDNGFPECHEGNNILIRSIEVTSLPDMRILSQHIGPSLLNPQPNQPVQFQVTYENIGVSNINQSMKLKIQVDNTVLDSIYPVPGLIHQGNITFTIPANWSSNMVGVHVIRAIIDADDQVTETNELNNEATRAIVVGESANLYFQYLGTLQPYPLLNDIISLSARVGNNGDLSVSGDLEWYYVNDLFDTVFIQSQVVNLAPHDSVTLQVSWQVADPQTTIIAKLVNSSVLEYTYDDNTGTIKLGEMLLLLRSAPACNNLQTTGGIQAEVLGGLPPYNYFWNNGFTGTYLNGGAGSYSLTATDQTGNSIQGIAIIDTCPAIQLNIKCLIQGYLQDSTTMKPVILNQGHIGFKTDVDTILIELRKDTTGYPLVWSDSVVLQTDGWVSAFIPDSNLIGESCYLVLKHRNSISTWSAEALFLSELVSYDFTNQTEKAFGNNQFNITGNGHLWAFFNGDINQDGNIDLIDNGIMELTVNNFEIGYLADDVNGDGNTDLLDLNLLDQNIESFIFSQYP